MELCSEYLGDIYKYWHKTKAIQNAYKTVQPENIGRETIKPKTFLCMFILIQVS